MTFDEYQEAVMRTARVPQDNFEKAVLALGLCGEAIEIYNALALESKESVFKEVGDFFWYIAALAKAYGISQKDFLREASQAAVDRAVALNGNAHEISLDLLLMSATLAELVKKDVAHNKPLDKQGVANYLVGGLIMGQVIAQQDFSPIAEANIEKLKARYPDGFKTV